MITARIRRGRKSRNKFANIIEEIEFSRSYCKKADSTIRIIIPIRIFLSKLFIYLPPPTSLMVKGNGLIDFVLGYDTQELRKSSETERIAASGAILNYVDNVVDNYLSEKHPLLSNPVRYGMRVALELHPHISTFNWVHDIATRYNLKQSPGSKIMEVCYYINGERKTLNLGGN